MLKRNLFLIGFFLFSVISSINFSYSNHDDELCSNYFPGTEDYISNNCGHECPSGEEWSNSQAKCVSSAPAPTCADSGQLGTYPNCYTPCSPNPIAITCSGATALSVTNNCGTAVNCGNYVDLDGDGFVYNNDLCHNEPGIHNGCGYPYKELESSVPAGGPFFYDKFTNSLNCYTSSNEYGTINRIIDPVNFKNKFTSNTEYVYERSDFGYSLDNNIDLGGVVINDFNYPEDYYACIAGNTDYMRLIGYLKLDLIADSQTFEIPLDSDSDSWPNPPVPIPANYNPENFDNCPYKPNFGQVDSDGDGIGDRCDLTPLPSPIDTSNNSTMAISDTDGDLIPDIFELEICYRDIYLSGGSNGRIFFGGCHKPLLNSEGDIFLPDLPMYDKYKKDIEVDIENQRVYVKEGSNRKIYFHYGHQKYQYFDGSTYENMTVDKSVFSVPIYDGDSSNTQTKTYRNQELLTSDDVALYSHRIKISKENIEKLLDDSNSELEDNVTAEKLITTEEGKSRIKINVSNIPKDKSLAMYLILSKDDVADAADINIISSGSSTFFISEKDPVIGWYFNESDGDEEVEFEIDGDSDGGSIIITEEAILYNEGELIINYRDSLTCNSDEAHLFNIDDLSDSLVYSDTSGSGAYSICIAHLTEDLYNDDTGSNLLSDIRPVFIYDASNLVQYDLEGAFGTEVEISVDDDSLYWDIKMQEENPDGTYSCLGSVSDLTDGLFGDCDYTGENRIWLHLGEDYTPPTTEVSYPYLAHTTKITLTTQDNIGGSGVTDLYYCVDEINTCDPQDGTQVSATGPVVSDTVITTSFSVSCPQTWGCVKYIRYQAVDYEGTWEDVTSTPIKMLDKGSACQSTCLAEPTPGRYLSECNNLNSCNYYDYDNTGSNDDGVYVSGICDLLLENSYAKFNSSHDIQCPQGPFRFTRFVDEKLDLGSDSCNNLHTQSFPAILEGENVLLKYVVCLD